MATVKVVLRRKQNKDGTYPLALRITKDRKASFIHLGHSVLEKDWDASAQKVRKSYPNSARMNNLLAAKLADASDKALEAETQKREFSANSVKRKIKPAGGSGFFAQADLYLSLLKQAGKYNRYTADKPRIEHFRKFACNEALAFSDITAGMLERFQAYLKGEYGLSQRSVVNHLVVIRSVFSQAIKGEVNDRKYYPFGPGKVTIKFPDSIKVGLSANEVKSLEEADLPAGTYKNHCRNLWLFSFYFAGMRISDVLRLRWSDLNDGRLHYKVGKNDKGGSLKVPERARAILLQYEQERTNDNDLIFPELKSLPDMGDNFTVQRKIMNMTSKIDKMLRTEVAKAALISKKLTMHIARHTFGNLSGDRIPVQMLQKLYRHSSVTTTIGYQSNFIHRDADDALAIVVNL